jgi:methyl-accepting chemotaxis protein
MNQATQATAAGAEESASAAEELSSQASEMMSMVKTFQLTAGSRKMAPRPTAPVQKTAARAFRKHSKAEEMIPFASSDDLVLADF